MIIRRINSYFFIASLFIYGCAQMAVPTGGEKDTKAPVLQNESCDPLNGSVNFTGRKIHLEFDEFIRTNNPAQNVLISPALPGKVEYVQRGRGLDILLPDGLLPNTTYTIHFSNSISDITEGNVASELQYVFSTGPFLDSLEVSGSVSNAFTAAPEKGVMVGLYPSETDSAVYLHKPMYLALTDANGVYRIRNVRSGNYLVYAIRDNNASLTYDSPGEEAGFFPGTLDLSTGENRSGMDVRLIRERKEKMFVRKRDFNEPGRLKIYLSNPFSGTVEMKGADKIWHSNDTIVAWIYDPSIRELPMVLRDSSGVTFYTDTVRISRDEKKRNAELAKKLLLRSNSVGQLDRYSPLTIFFDDPVKMDPQAIFYIQQDTVRKKVQLTAKDDRTYQVEYSFATADNASYNLIVPTAAFSNGFAQTNSADTLRFKVSKEDFYGKLILLLNVEGKASNLLQLVNDKGQLIKEVRNYSGSRMEFPQLKPGNYRLRLIMDTDGNGQWSMGSVSGKILPEKVIYSEGVITIRSNWDLELEWKMK